MANDRYEDELDRMRMRRQRRKMKKKDTELEIIAPFDDEDTGGAAGAGRRKKEAGSRKCAKGRWKAVILAVIVILAGITLWNHFTGSGWWTVAVFGVDSRDGNLGKGALSDVEILASINKKSGEIRLLSVFRDSYLQIDREGTLDKINEAYFLGSHDRAVQALATNFDIKVDDYATFNWKAVVDAVNVLGGVDIEITEPEFAYINSFITETVNSTGVGSYQLEHSGMNHLDGVQAVAYARLRLMDTDFNRTERQRKVLGQAMEKAKQADAGTLATLVGTVFPQISTSIGVNDLMTLAKNPKRFYISETSGFPFSHTEMKIDKKSCVVPTTLESNVVQLHSFLYGDGTYTASDTVKKISAAIAAQSGLSDPGKDTESGKNVGASGNTGEIQSGAVSTQAPQTAASQTAPAAESSQPQTEKPAAEITDSLEDEAEETEEEQKEQKEQEDTEEVDPADHEETQISAPPTTADGTKETADNYAGPGAVQGPSSAPGSEGPSLSGPSSAGENNASLEAPGQNKVSGPESVGPGQS